MGCAVIWAKGVPSTPAQYFEGQRRKTVMALQGRFKRPVSVEDLVTGQEFARPPRNLPAKWLVEKVLIRVCARLGMGLALLVSRGLSSHCERVSEECLSDSGAQHVEQGCTCVVWAGAASQPARPP